MVVNEITREALRDRRKRRKLLAAGYEEVGEGGGKLWELQRSGRYDCRIVDAVIDPEGKSVWVKIEKSRDESALMRWLKTRATIAVLLLALTSATAAAQTISGQATVTDGDTIRVGDTRIRIAGIDAPEKTQTCESNDGRVYECGRDATAVMAELIRNRTVTCTPTGHSYNRIVATCSTESGDLGEQMVRRGWSVRVPRYDRECRYCAAEAEAKAAGRGIWSGRFQTPADFRRTRR